MFAARLTKVEKEEIFVEPYLSSFLPSLSFLFAAKIIRFLRLTRSLHNAKFVPSLSSF
jgi:hypothetical protein